MKHSGGWRRRKSAEERGKRRREEEGGRERAKSCFCRFSSVLALLPRKRRRKVKHTFDLITSGQHAVLRILQVLRYIRKTTMTKNKGKQERRENERYKATTGGTDTVAVAVAVAAAGAPLRIESRLPKGPPTPVDSPQPPLAPAHRTTTELPLCWWRTCLPRSDEWERRRTRGWAWRREGQAGWENGSRKEGKRGRREREGWCRGRC
jgi:hypothetical protein